MYGLNSGVQPVDRHSNKSALVPPTPIELASLVQQSGVIRPMPVTSKLQVVPVRSLRRRHAPQENVELVARANAGEDTPALSQEFSISKVGLRELLSVHAETGVHIRGHQDGCGAL